MSKPRVPIPLRPDRPAWMLESNPCSTSDPDLWHPEGDNKQAMIDAKKACGRCFNRAICLDYALDHRELHGTWGGLSANERKRLLRDADGAAA